MLAEKSTAARELNIWRSHKHPDVHIRTHRHTQSLDCGSAVKSFRQIFLVRLVFDYRLYATLLCPFLQQTHTDICV